MGIPFCWLFSRVLTVLSGMTYMEHLQDNLRTFCPLDPLSDADKEFLEETAQQLLRYPTIPCNDCKYCMPCPYGLDIPGILLHFNKCITRETCLHRPEMPIIAKPAGRFLSGMTEVFPNCAKPTIVSGATNACTIVRKTFISRKKCNESTSLSKT